MGIPAVQGGAGVTTRQNGEEVLRPLLTSERRATEKYLSNRPLAKLERGIEALTQDRAVKVRVKTYAWVGAGVGAGVGGIAGAGGTAAAIGAGMLAGPVGAIGIVGVVAGGAIAGAAAGAGTGAVVGAGYSVVTLRHSDEYRNWKCRAVAGNVLAIWDNFLNDLPTCPITGQIIEVPVRAPNGITYEQDAITEWINLMGLINAMPFQVADLSYDETYHQRLFTQMKDVYNPRIHAEIAVGVQQYTNVVLAQRRGVATAQIGQVIADNNMTEAEKDDTIKEIRRQVLPFKDLKFLS